MTDLALPTDPAALAVLQGAATEIKYRWDMHARLSQLAPTDPWHIWLIMTGRGWGKNRTAAELVCDWAHEGSSRRIHLIARTAADARDTMVEGEGSGIQAISPPWFMPEYEPSKRRLTWPNGVKAILFSAEKPDQLRGPSCAKWWADELATWQYMQETWDNLQFGARDGQNVQGVITTTPRPVRLIKELRQRSDVVVTHGHTSENRENLAPTVYTELMTQYGGTRIGRQELAGELLDDNPDALWKREWIERDRVSVPPSLVARVVALDPSATAGGDAAGIVVAGASILLPTEIEHIGTVMLPHYYVLQDVTIQGSPLTWARQAVAAFHQSASDRLVYEANQGGDMVPTTIRQVDKAIVDNGLVHKVWASKGKQTRAEPVAALAEQGRIHHVGTFEDLEDQQCEWSPGMDSPNNLDAMVWAITALAGLDAPQDTVQTVVMDVVAEFGGELLTPL